MHADPTTRTHGRVAVIGAGWAGCAAAVHLARAGVSVVLYEQARQLGGRARTVPLDGLQLDNGQHLLIGAYRATLELLHLLHRRPMRELFHSLPLTIRPFGTCRSLTFVARDLPAPLHFLSAILTARGLSLRERWALARNVRTIARADHALGPDDTVEHRFAALPRAVYHGLWEPLCLAALNTPPQRASARIFCNVLRSSLCGPARASHFLVPRVGLGELLPDPAAAFVAHHGGEVHVGQRIRRVAIEDTHATVDTPFRAESHDAVVIATGPHQLGQLEVDAADPGWIALRDRVARLQYESINTIHLGYTDASIRSPLQRLNDAPGQWVFDGGIILVHGEPLRLLSVVISANGAHDRLPQERLVHEVDSQLRSLSSALGALRFSRVFAERRATYACTPALDRPGAGRITARLHLAGDYTHPEFPATLEAAVQSGKVAARSVLQELARSTRHSSARA